MQVNPEKERFLLKELVPLIKSMDRQQVPLWGKMNLHQMIEHLTDSIRVANEKDQHETILTPAERLEATYQFMMSDKPFKENTVHPLLAAEPVPARNHDVEAAVLELDTELKEFYNYFKDDPGMRTVNPIFGKLNYAEWVQLLHKHAFHHLRQFSVAGPKS